MAFIALADLTNASFIPSTILQALALSNSTEQDNQAFLLAQLKDKNMLLIFDNTEHLSDCVELIIELLEHCPDIFILATSRETLDLQAEHIYDLGGLSYPTDDTDTAEAYDAIQLFLRAARRSHHLFTIDADNQKKIIRLCQLLHGSPLGLEFAAAWIRLLSPAEILEELEKT